MDIESNDLDLRRSASFSRTSSTGSSLRRRSLGLLATLTDDDIENEAVSQAGDSGDRALHSSRYSDSGNQRFSFENLVENGEVFPIPHDAISQSLNVSPLSTDSILLSGVKTPDDSQRLSWSLEYISCLVHLAVFGILGVLTRYLLQKLFGPGVAGVTGDQIILYLDLPSNMVGSFLMGWLGVVFKGDISDISDLLAIGLTTGYLGSLTTFSGWNQKMLNLSAKGQWTFAVLGYLIGLFLAAYSIIFGVETAKGFRWLFKRQKKSLRINRLNSVQQKMVVLVVLVLILGFLWSISGVLLKRKFNNGGIGAQLWLACMVGPLGVWMRWFLARMNGHGIGATRSFKWVPFGTLLANVGAACVMAALSTVTKVVNTKNCDTVVTGIQFGLLGCLSTVSTFIAEFNAMRESNHPWRAYVYASVTIFLSFGLGTLIYSVPVWAKGYN